MSWEATGWAVKQRVGAALTKYTLLTYAQYADGVGAIYWPQRKIAAEMEMGVDAVRDHTERLETLELIARFKTRRDNGGYSVDMIVVLFNDDAQTYAAFLRENSEPAERGGERKDSTKGTFPTVNLSLALDYDRPAPRSGVSRRGRDGGIPARPGTHPDTVSRTHPDLHREQEKDLIKTLSKTSVPPLSEDPCGAAEGQQGLSEADNALRARCLEACRTDKVERVFVDHGSKAFAAWVATYARLGLSGPIYSRRLVFDDSLNTASPRAGCYFPTEYPPDHSDTEDRAA